MAQVAQGADGVSILGEVQKPSGHGHEQLDLSSPAWAEELDQISSRGPFQPQPFVDSVKADMLADSIVSKLCSLFW